MGSSLVLTLRSKLLHSHNADPPFTSYQTDEPPPDGVVPLIFTSKLIGLDFGGPAGKS